MSPGFGWGFFVGEGGTPPLTDSINAKWNERLSENRPLKSCRQRGYG
jgi:hypothetical protein